MKKALIFDLDNTIYPVSSIADKLFGELFAVLDQQAHIINSNHHDTLAHIKEEMTRRPFQFIADKYGLKAEIKESMEAILRSITYDLPMQPFTDYHSLKDIPLDKYLVTTGYPKLQYSKIKQLGIEQDFKEIFIVDPDLSNQTKRDVFGGIIDKYNYQPEELLIIGDDPDSEIKAATELGIDTFLFDPDNKYLHAVATHKSPDLKAVLNILE
jgi:putative hydrolase of the HAD superfamily